MNRPIHLENGNILIDPTGTSCSRTLTIADDVVISVDCDAPQEAIVIDLDGRFALPGLVDSHLHLVQGASGMGEIDCSVAQSRQQFIELYRNANTQAKPNDWLVGFGWDEGQLGDTPDSSWLPSKDTVPMLAYRIDYHCAVLNETALAMLPLDEIEMMNGGQNIRHGIVREDALYEGVCPHLPVASNETKRKRVLQAITAMQSKGITLVGTMEDIADIENVLSPISLTVQMRMAAILLDAPEEKIFAQSRAFDTDLLHIFGFKAFLDGTLGSRTARMYLPWEDAKGTGLWAGIAQKGMLDTWIRDVVDAGFAPVMHAIGDAAVGKALKALEGLDGTPSRIEHAQFIADKDLPFIHGQMFGVQPLHQPGDAAIADSAVGPIRAKQLHDWRRMLQNGSRLSFGSDWPIAKADPLAAMQAAVLHGLTVQESMYASTVEGARSLGSTKSGFLTKGSFGDVAILDTNPFECDWQNTRPSVTMTILAGNIVYTKD